MRRLNFIKLLIFTFLLTSCVSVPLETVSFKTPGEGPKWKVGHARDHGFGKGNIKEYVRLNESIKNWSELITVQFIEGSQATPSQTMQQLKEIMIKRCPNTTWVVISEEKKSITYEWKISSCSNADTQHEIAKLIQGNDGIHRISYVAKTSEINTKMREEILKVFAEAQLMKGGKKVEL